MIFGILSGIFWAIDTLLLSKVQIFALLLVAIHDFTSFLFIGIFLKISKINLLLNKKQLLVIAIASMAGGLGMISFLLSIHYAKAPLASILSSLYPAFSVIIAGILLGQRLSKVGFLGLFIAVSFTISLFIFDIEFRDVNLLGVIFGLLCAMCWGSECVIINLALKDNVNEKVALFIRQGVSSSIALGSFLIFSIVQNTQNTYIINYELIVIAAFFATVSYTFYYKAIAKIGALRAMGLNISYSAWIIIFGFIVGETFSIFLLICAILIMLGSVTSNVK
ncbi:DMT family transporter [Campylobacter sp. RM16192]|uniref:DMT family transporter n=1 Tax=Campylobacter sp. RM16192 TaxID=1660080 RepID=UPI001451908C|nr:DMT family transporter [Campylobacter sp. RM16192]QCD51840.1 choline transporter [Campylobacter sp. RM16192]